MVRRLLLAGAFGAACLAAAPASAASFNCAKAATADEKAICKTLSLNDKDVEMSVLYNLVRQLVPMGTRGAIMDDQTAWLKQRRTCGANVTCIGRLYDKRIAEIRGIIDERVVSNGPF